MSTVNLYQAIDMTHLPDWDGKISISAPDHFRLGEDQRFIDYYGTFRYSASGVVNGTVTSLSSEDNGAYFSMSGFSQSASLISHSLEHGQGDTTLRILMRGDDMVNGSSGNDLIKGYDGNDTLNGNGGDDTFLADTGSDTIDGGSGTDKVIYVRSKDSYDISVKDGVITVKENRTDVDTLTHMERVVFNDGTQLALDVGIGEHAGAAYRLYQAAFDREPDTNGLSFWTKALDSGAPLSQIAEGFVASNEFKTLNPGSEQNSLINNYYLHVLHRTADDSGLQYWGNAMANGMKANELLTAFSESQENINNTATDLHNGVWLV